MNEIEHERLKAKKALEARNDMRDDMRRLINAWDNAYRSDFDQTAVKDMEAVAQDVYHRYLG